MKKSKLKLQNGNIIKQDDLQIKPIIKSKPALNFKYLDKCHVACFHYLFKVCRKDKKYIDDLQSFFYKFSNFDDLDKAIAYFTSSKGSTIDRNNKFVKRIIDDFKKNYPDETGLLRDTLIHIHVKGHGNGEFVIFGITKDNEFYVLGFDPTHDFDK